MNILEQVKHSRERCADYLHTQRVELDGKLYWKHSATHDLQHYPEHLLYGTWSGVAVAYLIGYAANFSETERAALAAGLHSFQQPDGYFNMPSVTREHHSEEYFLFHCTNYALGALRLLDKAPRYPYSFMDQFAERPTIFDWLDHRDWSKPWSEGNNVVNMASFYAVLGEDGVEWGGQRLRDMAEWHDQNQNPQTGFWHSDQGQTRTLLVNAMAGASHNLHIYFYLNRPVPNAERIVDKCLELSYMGIRSACHDIDMVDILSNLRVYGYRVAEIDRVLERYLVELLQIQNKDGGFGDNYVTSHTLYGHVTPGNQSVMWTTWFRMATIGMVVSTLFPGESTQWKFRNTLGMGYFNPAYTPVGASPRTMSHSGYVSSFEELHLAAFRRQRFARQRTKWVIQQVLQI